MMNLMCVCVLRSTLNKPIHFSTLYSVSSFYLFVLFRYNVEIDFIQRLNFFPICIFVNVSFSHCTCTQS